MNWKVVIFLTLHLVCVNICFSTTLPCLTIHPDCPSLFPEHCNTTSAWNILHTFLCLASGHSGLIQDEVWILKQGEELPGSIRIRTRCLLIARWSRFSSIFDFNRFLATGTKLWPESTTCPSDESSPLQSLGLPSSPWSSLSPLSSPYHQVRWVTGLGKRYWNSTLHLCVSPCHCQRHHHPHLHHHHQHFRTVIVFGSPTSYQNQNFIQLLCFTIFILLLLLTMIIIST